MDLDLAAEDMSESVSKRGALRRGEADPSFKILLSMLVNPVEDVGSDSKDKTLVIVVAVAEQDAICYGTCYRAGVPWRVIAQGWLEDVFHKNDIDHFASSL